MKAMIFAAGKGTRLEHLTKHTPKALVKTGDITLLEHVIRKLKQAGVTEIIINVHHFYDQIIDFIEKNNFGLKICFSIEEDALLDTGGGLKKASWFFDDGKPFFIHNVDVISDINLQEMYDFHCKENAMATLAVRNRTTQRYFLFDKNNHLCGRENLKTNECILLPDSPPKTELNRLAFSGIHIVSPQIFDYMPTKDIFPITELYLNISPCKILAYQHDYGNWEDMGKISCYVF
jgi:NDP-sugar pyrophosphorylase family protein